MHTFQVEPCCWSTYSVHRDTQATLAILDKLDIEGEKLSDEEIARLFGYEEEYNRGTLTKWQKLRPRIWALFDEPYSSTAAKCIACMSILFICLSVLCFCLKSHTMTKQRNGESLHFEPNEYVDHVDSYPVLFYLEHTCNAWFTLEITLRCLVRRKLSYCCYDGWVFMVFDSLKPHFSSRVKYWNKVLLLERLIPKTLGISFHRELIYSVFTLILCNFLINIYRMIKRTAEDEKVKIE